MNPLRLLPLLSAAVLAAGMLGPAASQDTKHFAAIISVENQPGVPPQQCDLFYEFLLQKLGATGWFDLLQKSQFLAIVDDQGGCQDRACYFSLCQLIGLDRVFWGSISKKRTNFEAVIHMVEIPSQRELHQVTRTYSEDVERLPADFFQNIAMEMTAYVNAVDSAPAAGGAPAPPVPGSAVVVTPAAAPAPVPASGTPAASAPPPPAAPAAATPAAEIELAEGGTILRGSITGKLTAANSPYRVMGNLVVPSGEVLELEPGVELQMAGDYITIVVFGQLLASGTKEKPIIFRSGKKEVKVWDWDRIYFRSRVRSFLTSVIVENSNYGVYAINAAVSLEDCIFRNNSISAVYGKNSSLVMRNITVEKGHINAISLDLGAVAEIEGGTLTANHNGVLVQDYASLKANRLQITQSDRAVVYLSHAKVELQDPVISQNQVALVSDQPVPEKMLALLKNNDRPASVLTDEEKNVILTRPTELKSLKLGVDVKADTANFGYGLYVTEGPKEPLFSFIGSVTAGARYFRVQDTGFSGSDDTIPQKTYVPGWRPEVQIFTNSSTRGNELNLAADLYRDTHVGYRHNVFNLSFSNPTHQVALGDFTEDRSENSLSAQRVLGARYRGAYWADENGEGRVKISAGGGEIQIPLKINDNKPDIPNEKVDSNSALRQRLLGLATVDVRPVPWATLGLHYIQARDLFHSIFRQSTEINQQNLQDPALQSHTLGTLWNFDLGRNTRLALEWNECLVDSVHVEYPPDYGSLLNEYANQQANPDSFRLAELRRQGADTSADSSLSALWESHQTGVAVALKPTLQEYYQERVRAAHDSLENFTYETGDTVYYRVPAYDARLEQGAHRLDKFLNRSAYSMTLSTKFGGFLHSLFLSRVNPLYFSGGNPYLTPDRAIGRYDFSGEIREAVQLQGQYEYSLERLMNDTTLMAIPSGLKQFYLSTRLSRVIHDSAFDESAYYDTGRGLGTESPESKHKFNLQARFAAGWAEFMPNYTFYYDFKRVYFKDSILTGLVVDEMANDTQPVYILPQYYHENEMRHSIDVKAKLRLPAQQLLGLSYHPVFIKDLNNHPDTAERNRMSGFKHQARVDLTSKLWKNRIRNKGEVKLRQEWKNDRNTTVLSYELADRLEITLIPRRLQLSVEGRRRWYRMNADELFYPTYTEGTQELTDQVMVGRTTHTRNSYAEAVLKIALSAKFSINVSYLYDENTDVNSGPAESSLRGESGRSYTYPAIGAAQNSTTDNNFRAQSGGISLTVLF